jgi:hypothetical protein
VPELNDIINELPPELAASESTDDTTVNDTSEEEVDTSDNGDNATDETTEEVDTSDDTQEEETDNDNDDYFTSGEEETPPADTTSQPTQMDNESQYILTNLPKITVQLVMPTADGKDEVKQYDVYGWGDLPRNMKGFATPYEQGVFTASAQNNELRARELQGEFRQNKVKQDTEVYVQRENKAIADDLTELRQEGVFPKFKGIPGSKEFNESLGAKEFDKVVAYMNEQNDRYGKDANSGKSFRHIGFREAFVMLNGPNLKAAEKKDMEGRRKVAGKLKTGSGTDANTKTVSTKRVSHITDLADEFAQFAGNKS